MPLRGARWQAAIVRVVPGCCEGDEARGHARNVESNAAVQGRLKGGRVQPAELDGAVEAPEAVEDGEVKARVRVLAGVSKGDYREPANALDAARGRLRGEALLEHQVAREEEGGVGDDLGVLGGIVDNLAACEQRVADLVPHRRNEVENVEHVVGPPLVAEGEVRLGDGGAEEEELGLAGDPGIGAGGVAVDREVEVVVAQVVDAL
mmetsp:Transcript_15295/g.38902  ORF Transcript_15295/g.38902 Transcript_15295/m.38902 type:complete len:206 (-) Transcript_15295:334-951(-)